MCPLQLCKLKAWSPFSALLLSAAEPLGSRAYWEDVRSLVMEKMCQVGCRTLPPIVRSCSLPLSFSFLGVYICVQGHMYVEPKDKLKCPSRCHASCSLSRLGCLARELQEFSCLCLSSTGITSVHYHA